jgi:hypothetical protein
LFKEEVCSYNNFLLIAKLEIGRAMAEAVSCCLSPQRLRFVPLLVHVVFVVEKMTLGQVFSELFGFSLLMSFSYGSPCLYIMWE